MRKRRQLSVMVEKNASFWLIDDLGWEERDRGSDGMAERILDGQVTS